MNMITLWRGKPITELSKEELLEVVEYCGEEIARLTRERDGWHRAANPIKHLMRWSE